LTRHENTTTLEFKVLVHK